MNLIPSGAGAAGPVMILSLPRSVCLALVCLAGFTSEARAMGDTSFTRSSSASRAREDTLAWSLLGTAFLTFGMVTVCGCAIRRHQRRSGPEAEFLDELQRRQKTGDSPATPPPPSLKSGKAPNKPAWEKPADWWRQDFPPD